jgi:S-DNA-T family DNA segregation ATPase FtsK/SpoIIIE
MPHLLIAGRTGSGKSVFLNTSILSLICSKSPEELNILLIDPKQVEFMSYTDLPHLYNPIITNEISANIALQKLVDEMENRYELFREYKVKKLSEYNNLSDEKLPYIVCIIDEYADLVLMSKKYKQDIETSIIRLAQKARAAGIHLIIATQKPITQVLTTLIRSNIPARIAFAVCTSMDSKIILDSKGAEELLGNGDMLFLNPKTNKKERIQAPFLSNEDINLILSGE